MHEGVQRWVRDLNRLYRQEPALYELDFDPAGFAWIDCSDTEQSVVLILRNARSMAPSVIAACNFTPVPRHNYGIGVPFEGFWAEVLNSDATYYGGSGQGNMGGLQSVPLARHGHPQSITATLPPLGIVIFRRA